MQYTFTTTSGAVLTITCTREQALENLTKLHVRYLECLDEPWLQKTAQDCLTEIAAINSLLKEVDKPKL